MGEAKILQFSGYTWGIKESGDKRVAPGPNYYSSDTGSVSPDEKNWLHMSIMDRNDRWFCSEIFTKEKFGYGTYTVELITPLSDLDPQMVLGLFTYDLNNRQNHQEIDIEFSRWGNSESPLGNYTVQPYEIAENGKSFDFNSKTIETTHIFTWEKDQITFSSYYGHDQFRKEDLIQFWIYKGDFIPEPQKPSFRINLWLFHGVAPEKPFEIIIKSFSYNSN